MLRAFAVTRFDRLAAPYLAGRGVILTMHHVWRGRTMLFQPNRILEISPDFLQSVIRMIRAEGLDICHLDEVPTRLRQPGPKFVVLTFDDGYRDNLTEALPVLKANNAPFALYLTPGFADGHIPLWWRDLEDVVSKAERLDVPFPEGVETFDCSTGDAKRASFEAVYWRLRRGPEQVLDEIIEQLCAGQGIDRLARLDQLCMTWPELQVMAREPLCTIGAHTMTHPMLAKHPEHVARAEIFDSKRRLEAEFNREIRHLSYPVGDAASAGVREFSIARAAGFETAVTTRPGVLFQDHANHLLALPRISLNGLFQTAGEVRTLLSGLPTALQNRFRRINVS